MKLFTFVAYSPVGAKYQRGEGSIFHLNNAINIDAFFLLFGFLDNLISREVSVGLGIDMRNADIKKCSLALPPETPSLHIYSRIIHGICCLVLTVDGVRLSKVEAVVQLTHPCKLRTTWRLRGREYHYGELKRNLLSYSPFHVGL